MGKSYVYTGHPIVGEYVERRLAGIGWVRAESPRAADAAITYCLSQSAHEDAYFEDDGLIRALAPGALIVDLSPATPSFSRELAAIAAVNDLLCVEAPLVICYIDVADPFADPSGIMCLVAGEDEAADRAMPVIEAIAGAVERVGAAGNAQARKAARTIADVACMLAEVETNALASAIDAASSVDALGGFIGRDADGSGKAPACEAPDAAAFSGTYTVEMMMGEIAAVLAAAEEAELAMPQLESASRLLEVLAVIGGVDMRPQALSLLYCEEEKGAAAGLDWRRARALYVDNDDEWDGEDDYPYDGYDDEDGFDPFGGAHGGYSGN